MRFSLKRIAEGRQTFLEANDNGSGSHEPVSNLGAEDEPEGDEGQALRSYIVNGSTFTGRIIPEKPIPGSLRCMRPMKDSLPIMTSTKKVLLSFSQMPWCPHELVATS